MNNVNLQLKKYSTKKIRRPFKNVKILDGIFHPAITDSQWELNFSRKQSEGEALKASLKEKSLVGPLLA